MTNSFAVCDIGSNSIRLLVQKANGKSVVKVKTVRLGEGVWQTNTLKPCKIKLAVSTINKLVNYAKRRKIKNIYLFATAAVRNAQNKNSFIYEVAKKTKLTIDVLSGEKEAQVAKLGVIGAGFGTVVDLGGNSTEISAFNEDLKYNISYNFGAVSLYNQFKKDSQKITDYVNSQILQLPPIQEKTIYLVGGTATTLAALMLKKFSNKVDGYILTQKDLETLLDKLQKLTSSQIKRLAGMDKPRADIIYGGALALKLICLKLNALQMQISLSDNLQGYAKLKNLTTDNI